MHVIVYCLTVLLIISHGGHCLDVGLGDVVSSIVATATGVIASIPRSIPTLEDFFDFGKNAFIGLPYQIAFAAINEFCKFEHFS